MKANQAYKSLTQFLFLRYLISLIAVALISSASVFWLLKNTQKDAINLSLSATEEMLTQSIRYEVQNYDFKSLHDSLIAFQKTMHLQRIEVIGGYNKTIANVGSSSEGAQPDAISRIESEQGAVYGTLRIWYSETQNDWLKSDANSEKYQIAIVLLLFVSIVSVLSLLFFRLIKRHVQQPLTALSKHMNKHVPEERITNDVSERVSAISTTTHNITNFIETNELGDAYSSLELRWLKAVETKNDTLNQLRRQHSILLEVLELAKITVVLSSDSENIQLMGTALTSPVNALLNSTNTNVDNILASAEFFDLTTRQITVNPISNELIFLLEIEDKDNRIWTIHNTDIESQKALLVREITQERRLEQALLRSEKLKSVGQLSSSIAHDFNNLIASILVNLELIRDSVENNQVFPSAMFESIEMLSAGVVGRISSLRRLAIDDDGKMETVDQYSRLLELKSFIDPSLGTSIQLSLELQERAKILCDDNEFENTIVNLLVNAKQAMNERGNITVRTRKANEKDIKHCKLALGQYVAIDVIDEGPGIESSIVKSIFEPFFSTRQLAQGTGLGLAQVHAFCTRSGGNAYLNPDYALGAKFTLLLPISQNNDPANTNDTIHEVSSTESMIIYILDDNVLLANSVARLLQAHGMDTTTYSTLSEFSAEFTSNPKTAVLLSDVHIPDSTFHDVINFVQTSQPYLNVVFYSGNEESLDAIGKMNSQIPTITKPFRTNALIRTLSKAAKRSSNPNAAS